MCSFQAAFYRCAIVATICACSLIYPPMQVYGFYNSSPASWTMSGTPLLSGTIATCSCAKKKHFEVWPALTIWRRRGIGPRLKCRWYILWLLLHLLEMNFIWTGVWQGQPPLDGEGWPVLAFQRRLSCLHKIHTCPHKKNSCSHKNNFLIHVSSRYSERRTLCMAGI